MAKHKYKCTMCDRERTLYFKSQEDVLCSCKAKMALQLPILGGKAQVKECVDKDRNISWIDDQEKILQDRKKEHYWKVLVPEMVNSGTYSIQTMLENGWIYFDANEKLQIRIKPPEAE